MKENKKAILEILKKKSKKDGKFENLVLNLALQKIDSDNFEFDGETYPVVKIEISSTSHPFYTGKSKLVDTAGRVDRFMNRYGKLKK